MPLLRLRGRLNDIRWKVRGVMVLLRRRRLALASAAVFVVAGAAGVVATRHGEMGPVLSWLTDARDFLANASGFRINTVAIAGHKHLSRDEVLAIAGVNGHTSLLFLDAAEARTRLQANPWIGDATVQKLFPDQLTITVNERKAFALWQKDGKVNVIADDGTVLEAYVTSAVINLPFVVGAGAEKNAKDFLALLGDYPDIRQRVQASIMVGERRWNLKLKNGVEIHLPETDLKQAFDQLASLDRENKLLSRDITAVDLRVPNQVIVQLSDSAAQAHEEALKAKRPKSKGGAA